MRIILMTVLWALPFTASAYTHHFVPRQGAIFGDIEGSFINGSYKDDASGAGNDISGMGFTARAGYGLSDQMGLYADLTYISIKMDASLGIVSVQNDQTGIRDFRGGIRGKTRGETFEILYSALLSVPADSSYKENRDSNPSTTSPSEGRIGIIPQAGFQFLFPTFKVGLLAGYTLYPTDGKAEVTSGALVYTGDRKGGETTTVDLFIEGGVTPTLVMGGLISYNNQAKGEMRLQSGIFNADLSTDSRSYTVYQVYGSFTVSENTRLIPQFGYWNYAVKEMKNQQIFGGSLALRMVY